MEGKEGSDGAARPHLCLRLRSGLSTVHYGYCHAAARLPQTKFIATIEEPNTLWPSSLTDFPLDDNLRAATNRRQRGVFSIY